MAHDKKGYWLHESGDANHYTILKDNNWVASVQMNGELFLLDQKEILQNFINVLNQKK